MIAEDFNAEIGERQVIDNQKLIGAWSTGVQNYRGFMLKRWCEVNDMTIANSLYPKTKQNTITYVGPNKHERQIDYALLSRRTKTILRNSGSTGEVDLGSDHRAIEVVLELTGPKKKRQHSKRTKTVAWKSVNEDMFRTKASELLQNAELSRDTQTRCQEIERILLDAAASSVDNEEAPIRATEGDQTLRELLERRRTLRTGTTEKTEILKQIQKHVRRIRREKRHEHISDILREFRDIKRIPKIKTVQKRSSSLK